jgi:hypothetical protein
MTSTNERPGQADAPEAPEIDPLAIARDWAARVGQIADHYAARERAEPGFGRIEAQIHGAGRQQYEAAQMAAYMSLVSAAGDLRRIANVLCRTDERLDQLDRAAEAIPEPFGDPLPGFEVGDAAPEPPA